MDIYYPRPPSVDVYYPGPPNMDIYYPRPPSVDGYYPRPPSVDVYYPRPPSVDGYYPRPPSVDGWLLSRATKYGHLLSQATKCGRLLSQATKCGRLLSQATKCGHLLYVYKIIDFTASPLHLAAPLHHILLTWTDGQFVILAGGVRVDSSTLTYYCGCLGVIIIKLIIIVWNDNITLSYIQTSAMECSNQLSMGLKYISDDGKFIIVCDKVLTCW